MHDWRVACREAGPPCGGRGAPCGAVDVARRDDWPQLRRDTEQVRDGHVDADAEGFAT